METSAEPCVIAAGPLCSDSLYDAIPQRLGTHRMSFYDEMTPAIAADGIDRSVCLRNRYSEGEKSDYLNLTTLNRTNMERLFKSFWLRVVWFRMRFEQRDLFQACQPIENWRVPGNSLRLVRLSP